MRLGVNGITQNNPPGSASGSRLACSVSAVRSSATPDHLAVIQRGHPASGGHVLDGTRPASGRPALTCAFARCE
jgi:hypothetical protein